MATRLLTFRTLHHQGKFGILLSERRFLHNGAKLAAAGRTAHAPSEVPSIIPPLPSDPIKYPPPLSILPLSTLLRSYVITTLSSSPLLFPPLMRVVTAIAHSSSPILNPDRNPILHWILKKTFYSQYCAGESPKEVRRTIEGLKQIGYMGAILAFAKEVVMNEGDVKGKIGEGQGATSATEDECEEIRAWKDGTLETLRLAGTGDYVALKYFPLPSHLTRI